jgi:hypothetical protein
VPRLDFSINPVTGLVFEVGGTAIESPIDVALKFDLVEGANLKMPRFRTLGPVSRHLDGKGYGGHHRHRPDLMTGARTAVSEMVELLARRFAHQLDRPRAENHPRIGIGQSLFNCICTPFTAQPCYSAAPRNERLGR